MKIRTIAESRIRRAGRARLRARGHAHAVERDAAASARCGRRSASVPASRPGAVSPVPEVRRHDLAAGLAGEAVGDALLEVVADLDPDLRAPSARARISSPLSLPFSPMPRAVVLEHLDGVLADVAVRLERRHRGDDDDVAAGRLQRADQPVELAARSRGR